MGIIMSTENNTLNKDENNILNGDENNINIDIEKRNQILKTFINTFQEFVSDIKNSYPKYKDSLNKNYNIDINNIEFNMIIIDHFMMGINSYLVQISNKDESIFTDSDKKIVILKDIDFSKIWE